MLGKCAVSGFVVRCSGSVDGIVEKKGLSTWICSLMHCSNGQVCRKRSPSPRRRSCPKCLEGRLPARRVCLAASRCLREKRTQETRLLRNRDNHTTSGCTPRSHLSAMGSCSASCSSGRGAEPHAALQESIPEGRPEARGARVHMRRRVVRWDNSVLYCSPTPTY